MSPPASVVAVAAAAVVAAALLGAANAVENGDESVFDDAIHAHDPRAVLNEGACLHMLCDGDDAHANAHANAAMAQPGSNRSASFASSSFIKRQGKHLVEEGSGQPFHIAGTNSYYLLEHASESEPWLKRSIVDETYAHANALGLNVVRTWAFYDGEGKFQMRPGVYNETFFDALDWVIARAEAHGLRLILSLTNFWDAYGGMQEYVRWAAEANGISDGSLDGLDIRDFYRSEAMRQMYKDNFVALANRTNAYTGRRYKDDPTILAWELANEPRCPGDESGDVLQSWIQEMSRFVKDVAPKQLVTTGSEGFFGMSTPQLMHLNGNATFDFIEYLPMLCTGVDFVRNHDNTTAIDIPSFHLYPDHHAEELCHRGAPASDCAMQWTHAQTKVRVDLADDVLGKPLFIGEFGKMKHPLMEGTLDAQVVYRNRLFVEVYRQLEEAAIEGKASGGSTFWMLSAPAYKDYGESRFAVSSPRRTRTFQEKSVPRLDRTDGRATS